MKKANINLFVVGVLFMSYALPDLFYLFNILEFKTVVDVFFDKVHLENIFNHTESQVYYALIVTISFIGVFTVQLYPFQNHGLYFYRNKTVLKFKLLDFFILFILAITGIFRVYYSIGHALVISSLPGSGFIQYFCSYYLYFYFIYRCLVNNNKYFFLFGAVIIFITEISLLWRGVSLTLAVLYFLLNYGNWNWRKSVFPLLFLLLSFIFVSQLRNVAADSLSSENAPVIISGFNRFQGFTRSFFVVNSGIRFDYSESNYDAIRQIDTRIWGLNPEVKNSIGGGALGMAFFQYGHFGVFIYFHVLTLILVLLAHKANKNLKFRAFLFFIFTQFNLFISEGASFKVYFILFSLFLLIVLFNNKLALKK